MSVRYDICDVDALVVGGGGAGTRAAISAHDAGANVALAVKGQLGHCGSTSAAFGETTMYAATPERGDSRDGFYNDTVKAGMGLIDERLVQVLVEEARPRLDDLVSYGVRFEYIPERDLFEAGFAHSFPRTYLVATRYEREILRRLVEQVRKRSIQVIEGMCIARLLVQDDEIVGAVGVNEDDRVTIFRTPAVILANGGAHELFLHHPSTCEMTGDSFAMAYDAGALLTNMEFVQMGPISAAPVKRILGAPVWRLKPVLRNVAQEEILERYLPEGVTEDELFRIAEFPYTVRTITRYMNWAIFREIIEGRGTANRAVYLDFRHVTPEDMKARAPFTYQALKESGLDLLREQAELSIGVQCFHGGPIIDTRSQTTVPGLFACGEAAGGLMGPERPGGNALAECQVFGHRAGLNAARRAAAIKTRVGSAKLERLVHSLMPSVGTQRFDYAAVVRDVQETMFNHALTIRTEDGLARALRVIDGINETLRQSRASLKDSLVLHNMLTTARLILTAAIQRRESRGGHYREDFPEQKAEFDQNVLIRQKDGRMDVSLGKVW